MDDALLVGVLQRRAELPAQPDDFLPRQPAAPLQDFQQRLALDVLHRVVRQLLVLAVAEEADDVGVLELLEDFRLALETLERPGVGGGAARDELQGDALAGLVARQVDGPHGAVAQLALDGERANLLIWQHKRSTPRGDTRGVCLVS